MKYVINFPTGRLELLLKKKGRGRHKAEWKCVSITNRLNPRSIADSVEDWGKNYKVLGARFNGKPVQIPTTKD